MVIPQIFKLSYTDVNIIEIFEYGAESFSTLYVPKLPSHVQIGPCTHIDRQLFIYLYIYLEQLHFGNQIANNS